MGFLPTLAKTWLVSGDLTNTTVGSYNGYPELFVLIKNQLKAYGWVVVRSNNGVVANTSDNLNSASDMPQVAAPNQPWIVLRNPTTSVSMLWVFNDFGRITFSWSPAAGYTGGTTTTSPTATDEQHMLSAAFWASDEAGWDGNILPKMHARVFSTTDGKCTRMVNYQADGTCKSVMMFEQLDKPQMGNPVVAAFFPGENVGSTFNPQGPSRAYFNTRRFADSNAQTGTDPHDCVVTSDALVSSGALLMTQNQGVAGYPLSPVGLVAYENDGSTFVGWIGNLMDVWFSTDIATLATGSTFPLVGSSQFIKFGDLVFPWDGSSYPGLSVNAVNGNVTWDIGAGEGGATFHTTGIAAAAGQITVTFNKNVVLTGPALSTLGWKVLLSGPGRLVDIGNVTAVGNTVVINTTPQTLNATYTLLLPIQGIISNTFDALVGLFELPFLGVPTPVTVQMVKDVDARTIDVIFSIAVNVEDASNPVNYSIDHGLVVTAATRVTDLNYRLTTTRQTNDLVYTLIASNIGPL